MTEKYLDEGGPRRISIRNTRVFYLRDTMPNDTAEEIFGDLLYYVEFMTLSDYGQATILLPGAGFFGWMAMHRDGTWEVLAVDPLARYQVKTYDANYAAIVEYVSDRGTEFNRPYFADE